MLQSLELGLYSTVRWHDASLVSDCPVHQISGAQSQNREALIGSKTFATFGMSGELMDGDDSEDSSDSGVSQAPETGRLRTMLRSHLPIRCFALLVLTSLLLLGALFYSSRGKPLAREVVGQSVSLYSAQCMACGRREVLQCIVHSDGGRQPSEQHAKRPQRPYAQETFRCNDGCMIWQKNVNDDACHCSDCEDEEAWSCGTCGVALRSLGDQGETIHVAKVEQKQYATDVGVGVGVGLSSAFALGFGLAFGLDSKQVPNTSLPVLPELPGRAGTRMVCGFHTWRMQ